jgi:hypothetical protein
MSLNYIGFTPDSVAATLSSRFFYGFRRTDKGELFFGKVDQLNNSDSISVNKPGAEEDNYPYFEIGQDFFEGRNQDRDLLYQNLVYEQYRWDDRNALYYINDDGDLVMRLNTAYTYPSGISSDGTE